MTKLDLTAEQRERAELILEVLEENSKIPESHFPEWEEAMSFEQFDEQIESDVHEKKSRNKVRKWVPTADVVGPLGDSVEPAEKSQTATQELKSGRLEKIIAWMIDGEFEIDYDDYDLPKYAEFDGKFYVDDGRHRSFSCKAVGVKEIWGEVWVIR